MTPALQVKAHPSGLCRVISVIIGSQAPGPSCLGPGSCSGKLGMLVIGLVARSLHRGTESYPSAQCQGAHLPSQLVSNEGISRASFAEGTFAVLAMLRR